MTIDWRPRSYAAENNTIDIALAAEVPFLPASISGPDKTVTIGAPLNASGDLAADMDDIRTFFDGVEGIQPGNETPVLLAEEDE